ncbi:hypothetical protein [Agrobacterium rosae]|uniref:Uncharacterized protein n=1 Tax=Agrobacterium rosae TaxID=1972867 RepID=A0AAW9FAG0_9HYPH|nr:hypothetical protein [Agrobacterium rosae]MDX8301452.1 hypothetical protein [Agrobacterium rosae]
MNAVNNHVAIPFFSRVPPRANDILISTFDSIVDQGVSLREAFYSFSNSVRERGLEGPTNAEFQEWFGRVRNGLLDRPHPSILQGIPTKHPISKMMEAAGVLASSDEVKQPFSVACTAYHGTTDFDRLKQARGIVEAAHHLFEAKIAAGYSPLSVSLDDTIVAEALKQLLEEEAVSTVMDADVHMTPGNKLADLLLGLGDDDIDAKIVDCLAIDMQQEICRELVKRPPPQPR